MDNAGHYVVGPSPSGETVNGTLTAAELEEVNQDATTLVMSGLTASPVCIYVSPPAGGTSADDEVDLSVASFSTVNVYVYQSDSGSLCTTGDAASARTLRADLYALLQRYYPPGFPSA